MCDRSSKSLNYQAMNIMIGKIYNGNKDFSHTIDAVNNLLIFSPHPLSLGFSMWELVLRMKEELSSLACWSSEFYILFEQVGKALATLEVWKFQKTWAREYAYQIKWFIFTQSVISRK